MQPSNYGQMGRRRASSCSDDQDFSANIGSCCQRSHQPPASSLSCLRKSYSGSNLSCHHSTNSQINDASRRASATVCGLSLPVNQRPSFNSHRVAEHETPCILFSDGSGSHNAGCSVRPGCSSTNESLSKICDKDRRSSEINNLRHANERSEDDLHERESHRSGSWTGVNESDDDMEELASAYVSPSLFRQSIPNGPGVLENSGRYSYQNSFTPTTSIESDLPSEASMKRRLKFFFMNPYEKWIAKGRIPWKLMVQVLKIIIVTAQLCMFASQRYNHVSYLWDTKVSFSHLFIKDWDTSREINAYPPSNGPLAIYRIDNFYEFLDYSIQMFCSIEKVAIGAYSFDRSLNGTVAMPTFCFREYNGTYRDNSSDPLYITNKVTTTCIDIPQSILHNASSWSVKEFLHSNSHDINFDVLISADLKFALKTAKLRSNEPFDSAECYKLEARLFFNNRDHDGQMLVDLNVGALIMDCDGPIHIAHNDTNMIRMRFFLNILTIIICGLSLLMCMRALYRAQLLKSCTMTFFKSHFNRRLTKWEEFEFINLWYVLICVNDILIVIGSFIKIGLEMEDYEGYLDQWNICSLLLGTGNLLVWFGVLRYLGFFETYNVLILTIKSCFPNVLRYFSCILMVFCGYSFCGWLILGPYHLKFRSLSSTIECLYSLVNGDDMFATFSAVTGGDSLIWWFSRIYLYTFISLFIYVILSLFIAIIMDSYETIKCYYQRGFPCSELRSFASECEHEPHNGAFVDDDDTSWTNLFNSLLCCCRRPRTSVTGYEPIPS